MSPESRGIWFGHTTLTFHDDRPLMHPSAGLYVPVNMRGILGAGLAAEVRLAAGPDVELELREHVPLVLGDAYLVRPGKLAGRGVEAIAFGVAVRDPCETPRIGMPEMALKRGLELFEDALIRDITIPLVNRQMPERQPGDNARAVATHIAAHLRRRSKLRHIKVAGLDNAYLDALRHELLELGGSTE
ncbi:MAG: hypothetical protein ACOC9Y_10890 [Chloroflexota bacterium]